MQYIPSVNLDTLLGCGLGAAARERLLGQMAATPRYSDPLPHNWVVGEGARAIRIDRVDKRFDRDVDEAKGYWGRATRGYLHLLGYHACLPIAADGLPAAMGGECATPCGRCADGCSYLPKGGAPCAACLACGECVSAHAAQTPGGSDVVPCQKTYKSMHQARKVWGTWQQADQKWLSRSGGH
jgi:hypothetical protein